MPDLAFDLRSNMRCLLPSMVVSAGPQRFSAFLNRLSVDASKCLSEGIPLFERTRFWARPTAAGDCFMREWRSVLANFARP